MDYKLFATIFAALLNIYLGLRILSRNRSEPGNIFTRYEVKKVQDLLNGRPRAALNFQKPYEVFNQLINNAVALNFRK